MKAGIRIARFIALAGACLATSPAWAAGSVLSGMFDGSETSSAPLPGSMCSRETVGFAVSEFEVTAGGVYSLYNGLGVFDYLGTPGIVWRVYQGGFDPSSPNSGTSPSGELGRMIVSIPLEAGRPYTLVVQHLCEEREGAWAIGFTGPGTVVSSDAAPIPAFTAGRLDKNSPVMDKPWCDHTASAPYQQHGPVRLARSGTYYFTSPPGENSAMCLMVYSQPVNSARPTSNLVTLVGENGTVELVSGQDYYFVVQRSSSLGYGDYLFMLAPPAPFRINAGMVDAWYNPETPGQGFFLDVYERRNDLFLGWFTFDLEPAPAGHRWLTAFGGFHDSGAALAIEWTRPPSSGAWPDRQFINGTVKLEFDDCRTGQVEYAWDGDDTAPQVAGVIPIQRITEDSVALCESLYDGPGMPGPL